MLKWLIPGSGLAEMSSLEIIRQEDNPQVFWQMVSRMGEFAKPFNSMYTKSAMEFYRQRYFDEQIKTEDKTFALLNDGTPVIIFFGVVANETHLPTKKICWYEAKATFWQLRELTKKEIAKLKEYMYKEILREGKIVVIRDHLEGAGINKGSLEIAKEGIVISEKIIFTRILDLTLEENELKRDIRKSYKSLINWGIKKMKLNVYDHKNITIEVFEKFRSLHREEAGRETRSSKSWRKQYEAIRQSEAFCIYGELDNEIVTAGYFMTGNGHCYYGSSASKRSLFEKPLFHSIMWLAIIHAKNIGLKVFETGGQILYDKHDDNLMSTKERHIAEFKAGFGGKNKMILDLEIAIETTSLNRSK